MKRSPRVPVEILLSGCQELSPSASHYVGRVLRKSPGDQLLLFDPERGQEADAEVLEVDGARVFVRVEAVRQCVFDERKVVLIQAVGKGDKLDLVVQDATELGVTQILPVLSERTVVQPGPKAAARVERWRRIAIGAARQCGRARAPEVLEITPLLTATKGVEADLRLVLVPGASRAAGPLLLGEPGTVALVVGPEGGLSESELEVLEEQGWIAASLGPTTLRTETVAAAVLGALLLVGGGQITRLRPLCLA